MAQLKQYFGGNMKQQDKGVAAVSGVDEQSGRRAEIHSDGTGRRITQPDGGTVIRDNSEVGGIVSNDRR
jgi:hypothetical protein